MCIGGKRVSDDIHTFEAGVQIVWLGETLQPLTCPFCVRGSCPTDSKHYDTVLQLLLYSSGLHQHQHHHHHHHHHQPRSGTPGRVFHMIQQRHFSTRHVWQPRVQASLASVVVVVVVVVVGSTRNATIQERCRDFFDESN